MFIFPVEEKKKENTRERSFINIILKTPLLPGKIGLIKEGIKSKQEEGGNKTGDWLVVESQDSSWLWLSGWDGSCPRVREARASSRSSFNFKQVGNDGKRRWMLKIKVKQPDGLGLKCSRQESQIMPIFVGIYFDW